jgi:hypothetical protein
LVITCYLNWWNWHDHRSCKYLPKSECLPISRVLSKPQPKSRLLLQACLELYDLAISGRTKEAEKAQIELAAVEWGFAKGGINGTKWVVAKYLGYPEASCHTRRPYPRYSDVKKQAWIMDIMRPLEEKEKSLAKI